MLVLGLVLIALAAVVIVILLAAGANAPVVVALGNVSWDTSAMAVFLCGVAAMVLLGAGLYLVQVNARRSRRRRRENKQVDRAGADASPNTAGGTTKSADRSAQDPRQPGGGA